MRRSDQALGLVRRHAERATQGPPEKERLPVGRATGDDVFERGGDLATALAIPVIVQRRAQLREDLAGEGLTRPRLDPGDGLTAGEGHAGQPGLRRSQGGALRGFVRRTQPEDDQDRTADEARVDGRELRDVADLDAGDGPGHGRKVERELEVPLQRRAMRGHETHLGDALARHRREDGVVRVDLRGRRRQRVGRGQPRAEAEDAQHVRRRRSGLRRPPPVRRPADAGLRPSATGRSSRLRPWQEPPDRARSTASGRCRGSSSARLCRG